MGWEDWIAPAVIYLIALGHHVLGVKARERAEAAEAVMQTQLERVREGFAMWNYGAKDEASALIEEAVKIGEDYIAESRHKKRARPEPSP